MIVSLDFLLFHGRRIKISVLVCSRAGRQVGKQTLRHGAFRDRSTSHYHGHWFTSRENDTTNIPVGRWYNSAKSLETTITAKDARLVSVRSYDHGRTYGTYVRTTWM